ncbi:MAG: S8 family serine peptidase, partial [Bdellovibrionales bacterium]|nr:S8 family serine peptidase [Bdellovibrionales bacterium]
QKAWTITQGSRDIKVAVIDTGCDMKHPDLLANYWKNAGEIGFDSKGRDKATNGIDDDTNGFIDDVSGWNFVSNTNDLSDNHGHGTHISGIVGAEGGNGIGISGVSPKVSLMCLKYYDPKSGGGDNLKNTIRAIRYAIQMGADVINYSGGGLEYSSEEYQAVKAAKEKCILFVAAAGNEYSNSDKSHYFPANYSLDNIVSVTAINPSAQVLKSSNYGIQTVHIAAPGENIFSTLPNSKYGVMTGTSQATAFVSGVAALIMASNREFKYLDVRKQILSTADEMDQIRNKTKTSGKLNSWAALAIQRALPITGAVVEFNSNRVVFSSSLGAAGTDAPRASDQITRLGSLMERLRRPAKSAANPGGESPIEVKF